MNSALHTSTERFLTLEWKETDFFLDTFFEFTIIYPVVGLIRWKMNPQIFVLYRLKFNRIRNNVNSNEPTTIR